MSYLKKNEVNETELLTISKIVDKSINEYIKSREQKVAEFVSTHFNIKGAFRINKKAFGLDMVKAPINIVWMVPYLIMQLSSKLTSKIGLNNISLKMGKFPKGIKTAVEREVNWLIYNDLLEIPYKDGDRESNKNKLLETCLAQPEMKMLLNQYFIQITKKSENPEFRASLENNINELTNCRTAASDLAGCVVSLASGAMVGKFTPGAVSSGTLLATTLAQQVAISNFFLGNTIGSLWYGLFPASASLGLLATTTGSAFLGLGVVSAFAGIFIDPIQAKIGLHEKRLKKLIEKIRIELTKEGDSRLQLKDVYVKYVFDIVDFIKSAAFA
jgi:hypothetical protein